MVMAECGRTEQNAFGIERRMMRRRSILRTVFVSLACWGVVFPQSVLLADGAVPAAKSRSSAKRLKIMDVAMSAGGQVTGQVVDGQGIGLDGAVVTFLRGKQKIASTVTDRRGDFVVRNLSGGTYDVVAGQGHALFRCWVQNTSPPSATHKPVIVSATRVIRGQSGGVDIITLTTFALGVAAVTTSAISLHKAIDLEDEVAKIPPMSP